MTGARWSDAEDARLMAAYAAGLTTAQIAAELGRTGRGVHARIGVLRNRGIDLPRRREPVAPEQRWTAALDRRLIDGYMAGRTYLELAAELERTLAAVAGRADVLRRRGAKLPARRPRWTDERRRLLARRRREGASLRQLEREFSVTRGTLTAQLRRLEALGYGAAPPPR